MNKKKYLEIKKFFLKNILKTIFHENKKIINSKINFYSKSKSQVDPVTKFDLKIEKVIRNEIKKNYPSHNILGEEYKSNYKGSKYTWVIDPIDGTKALITGQPTWSNLISLYSEKTPLIGMANFPELNKTFYADKSGAYLNKKQFKKIKASKNKDLKNAKLITNSIHTFVDKKIYNFFSSYPYFFKITGIDAYNFCLLAEGKIDIIIESGLKQVDILPMVPIINASGGIITNWKGSSDLSKGQIIASANKQIHKKFLNYFKKKYFDI